MNTLEGYPKTNERVYFEFNETEVKDCFPEET